MIEARNLRAILREARVIWYEDFVLKYETYSKTGSKVDYFIVPSNLDQLKELVFNLSINGFQYKVIGHSTNILYLDSVNYSILITTKLLTSISYDFDQRYVVVHSGKLLTDFVSEVVMHSVAGFEGLEGIPGSVGGAIFMNAGAYGQEISDNLIEVVYINENGELKRKTKSECEFGERSSFFKNNRKCVILNAKFNLPAANNIEKVVKRKQEFHSSRHLYQEWVYPNLGSVFALPNTNIYKLIYSNSKVSRYKVLCFKLLVKIYQSNLFKCYRRKNPNHKLSNYFITNVLGCESLRMNMSPKTANTFVNKNNTSLELVSYIYNLKRVISSEDIKLENEILIDNISKVTNVSEFNETMRLIAEVGK